MVSETDVIAVEVPDEPGGLAGVLEILEQAEINIEYLYAFWRLDQGSTGYYKVEDCEGAIQALQAKNIRVLEGAEVYSL